MGEKNAVMPDRALSSKPVPAPYIVPYDRPREPLKDAEYGGVAISDSSQGLRVKVWELEVRGDDVVAWAPGVAETVLFSRPGITEAGLAFDQNMNPCVGFVAGVQMTLWWYDPIQFKQVFTDFAGHSPRVVMDDKRPLQTRANDILFVYVRDGTLCVRHQRDRFLVENALATMGDHTLGQVGMNSVNRIQFEMVPPEPEPEP